jgi:uncharacterized protein (TIGR02453 family)
MAKFVNPFEENIHPPFAGFPADSVKFLKQLAKNNNREWFEANKPRYEASIREPMESLLETLAGLLRQRVPDIVIDAKKAMYRIYRDVRFSRDKTPYKTWAAASFTVSGQDRKTAPGYYFHFTGTEVGIGGGLYAPDSNQLKNLRLAIDHDAAAFRKIIADKALRKRFGELDGERLIRVPHGFPTDHPAADLLRLKQFLCWKEHDLAIIHEPSFAPLLTDHFAAMSPFIRYLVDHC